MTAVAYSPDGAYVVTTSSDTTAKIWDAATGVELRSLAGHRDRVMSAVYSADSMFLVTGSMDKTAKIWRRWPPSGSVIGAELRSLVGHSNLVSAGAFSPDGTRVVTGSWDKTAKIWDAGTGAELRSFANSDRVMSAASEVTAH